MCSVMWLREMVMSSKESGVTCHFFFFFFFQAEDGIRDLVRFRGLGDVYKEQFFGTFLSKLTFFSTFLSKITFLSFFFSDSCFLSTFFSTFFRLLVTRVAPCPAPWLEFPELGGDLRPGLPEHT